MKVKQNQLQNDNSTNNSSSKFNSVTEQLPIVMHYEKLLVDKEIDTSLSEELTSEVSPANIPNRVPISSVWFSFRLN